MKILIPITYFGPTGGFRVLSEFANYWINQGNEVEFLAFKASDKPFFPTHAKLSWYDNEGNLTCNNDTGYKKKISRIFSVLKGMTKAIDTSSCDIILATLSLSAMPVFLTKNKGKKFYYVQAYEPEYFNVKTLSGIVLYLLSLLSYKLNLNIIVNSPLYFNYKILKSNKFVYPGIDFTKFYPNTEVKQIESFVIGTIGRVEPYKGTKYVLESYAELKKGLGHSLKLRIAFGNPELANELNDIEIVRPNNDKELGDFYRSLDVLIAPGLVQLGAVHYPVIEAMASKIPVVTTGYYPANSENAWVVPIKNSLEISNSIVDIIKYPELVAKKVNSAYNEISVFDWEKNSCKMIDYFKNSISFNSKSSF
jgi:glycosyltransferase involved in cell wall biosynthesis